MKTESTDVITHVCWDMDPKTGARCRRDPHHKGQHFDPHTRLSWNHPGTTWRAADLPPVLEAGGGRGAGGSSDHGFGRMSVPVDQETLIRRWYVHASG